MGELVYVYKQLMVSSMPSKKLYFLPHQLELSRTTFMFELVPGAPSPPRELWELSSARIPITYTKLQPP